MVNKKRTIIKKFRSYIHLVVTDYETNKLEKRGRTNKFNTWYYIKYIIKVLVHGYTWDNLDCICDTSTIRKKFYLWRDNGIIYKAYQMIVNYYINNKDITDLYIDSTVIGNDNCKECLGYSYKLKSKNAIKLNTIVTDNKITIAHVISNPSKHDKNFIEPCIYQVTEKIYPTYHKPIYISGDKGYTSGMIKNKLKQSNFILVYPNKKNTKAKKNYKYKEKLKKRFAVEVSYAYTKKRYKRIKNPTDSRILNYNAFYMLSIIFDVIKYLTEKRKYKKLIDYTNDLSNNQLSYNTYDPYKHIEY